MSWPRALLAWLLVIAAETVHGIIRQLFISPLLGDLPTRQLGVLVGSLIVFIIACLTIRWINAWTPAAQLGTGMAWVALTVAFELVLGTALGYPLERMTSDYDVTRGGYMAFGLLFMLFSPLLAAKVRHVG